MLTTVASSATSPEPSTVTSRTHWAGHTYIADIVAAGVRVFLNEPGYLHAKTISVDSRVCSIGSANIDIRSFSINYELNAVLYRSRKAVTRFRDSIARLLSPLL